MVQRFTVTDADDSPNGAPFTFDIRAGNDGDAFRVVQVGLLLPEFCLSFPELDLISWNWTCISWHLALIYPDFCLFTRNFYQFPGSWCFFPEFFINFS